MKSKNIRWIWVALAVMPLMFVATLSTSATPPSNDDIPITRWVSPDDSQPITYTEWQAQQPPPDPLYLEQAFSLEAAPQSANGTVVALVNPSIYSGIAVSLDQWKADVEGEGWSVDITPASFPSPASLRSYLRERPDIEGCLLIGDFPVPWYELDVSGHEEFPMDLFYMDLNGDWVDNDKDGIYDEHTGATAPEIWVGRLTASPLTFGGDEVTLLNNYFVKNHAYRQGSLTSQPRALNYVDDDWYGFADQWGSALTQVCDVTTTISDQEVTRAIDYADRLDDNYTWIQVCAHSWPGGHSFKYNMGQSWDWIYNSNIYSIDPHAFFYNLFACSAARFVEPDYIGGWYIFVDTYGIAAVGSTKTGSMLGFDRFYAPLDQGESLGEAFREWFANVGIYDQYWHYGMTLLGDPTLTSASQCNAPPEITDISVSETAINEGDTITLTVHFTDLGQNEHEAVIQWGDGVSQSLDVASGTSQFSVKHLYLDDDPSGTSSDGTTILVTVLDDDGGSDEASTTINVSNVPPEITALSVTPSSIDENDFLTLDVYFADPGADEHGLVVSWGDGTSDTYESPSGANQFSATHQYLDIDPSGMSNDEVTILVTVSDDDGGSDDESTKVTVSNVAPEITELNVSPSSIDENALLTLNVQFTDPGADEHEVAVTWGDGTSGTFELLLGERQYSTTHQYLDDDPSRTSSDEVTILVTVSDDDGGSDEASTAVTVSNVPPEITELNVGPSPIEENALLTLDVQFTDPGTDEHKVAVSWGDGTSDTFELLLGARQYSTTHRYLDDDLSETSSNEATILVTVSDDDGGSDEASTKIKVSNIAPEITALGVSPSSIDENDLLTLDVQFADPGADEHKFVVSWGDGTRDTFESPSGANQLSATHRYLDDDPSGTSSDEAMILVTVSDDDGGSDEASTAVTVSNVPPEITELNVGPSPIDENALLTLDVQFTDPGTDEHEVAVTWGDGTSDTFELLLGEHEVSAAHRYLDDDLSEMSSNEATIVVTVSDDDEGSDDESTTIIVSNVAPEITALGVSPSSIDENDLLTLDVHFADPGTDEHEVAVSWGDGTSDTFELLLGARQYSTTHRYLDDDLSETSSNEATILVTVSDDDEGSDDDSTTVSVSNIAPEITALGVSPSSIDENDLLTLDVQFADPGADEHKFVVSWGDGTRDTFESPSGANQLSATHRYLDDDPSGTSSDEAMILVTVSDDDGGSDEASTTIMVSNVAPVVSIDSITDEIGAAIGGGMGTGQVGLGITVVGSFFDVGTLDTHTVIIDWGDGAVEELEEDEGYISGEHAYETTGPYLITLTVTDDDGGVGMAMAEIKVAEPGDPLEEAIQDLADLLIDPDLDLAPRAAVAVQNALDKLRGEKKGKAKNGASDLMEKENWNAALEKIKQAVEALEAAEAADPDLDLSHIKSLLAETAKKIVVEQIALAESEATKLKELEKIAQANRLVNEGDDLLADHDYIGAVKHYQAAQRKVQAI